MTPGGSRGILGVQGTDYTGRTIPAHRAPRGPDVTTEAVT
jgi:hypothetical protein